MTKIKVGDKAPAFCLPDAESKRHCLKDYKGKYVVLYFYPKDSTPGCTMEAIDFSRFKKEFEGMNAVILGVSKDSCSSHQKFIDSKKLTITLLSDEDHKMQEKYGVWRPKKFMGREFLGTVRTTLLIDPLGVILKIWDMVKVKDHVEEVLDDLKEKSK